MLDIFKVGHYSDTQNGTGCTVILPPSENITSAHAMGASPGTREYALLSPKRKISTIHALVLTGGSAFGLCAACGVMDALEARKTGYQTHFGVVPIVPAAVVFDLNVGNPRVRPTAENGREALENCAFNNDAAGCVGAGTGTTVGKWNGMPSAMKGGIGIGYSEFGSIRVTALMVVNAVGDIVGTHDRIIAGAYGKDGQFLAENDLKRRWNQPQVGLAESTVLGAVMTNCRLTKQQAAYVAQRAHLAIARHVAPSHTQHDGDIVYVMSAGKEEAPLETVTEVTKDAVAAAVVDSVEKAHSLLGIKAKKDL